jgi:hypothetical protein
MVPFKFVSNHLNGKTRCKKMGPTSFVWNLDEINIQVKWQFSARVLAKWASNQICNSIPKSQEWFTINCAMNVIIGFLHAFYIFKGECMHMKIILDCVG